MFFIAWLIFPATAQAQPQGFSDDQGQPAQLARAPQRIVSLLPSLAETVCALGACQRLVGVDRHTNFPAQTQALPRVGGGLDPNIEAIMALRPDLVLAAGSTRGLERLRALGLTVRVFEPRSHADVRRMVFALGQLLQVDAAASLWQTLEAELQAAARALPPSARGTRVYLEVSSVPHAASASSFIGETLQRLGAHNIVPGSLGPFPQLNPEFVVRAAPDVLMLAERLDTPLHARPGWASLPAVARGRVCHYTAAEADILLRPGPRMGQAARLMADCLTQHSPRPAAQQTEPALNAPPAARQDAHPHAPALSHTPARTRVQTQAQTLASTLAQTQVPRQAPKQVPNQVPNQVQRVGLAPLAHPVTLLDTPPDAPRDARPGERPGERPGRAAGVRP